MARRFYAPLAVSAVEDRKTGDVDVYGVSDSAEPVDVELAWTLTRLDGTTVDSGRVRSRVPAGGSRKISRLPFAGALAEYGARDLLVWLELEGGDRRAENLVLFAPPKHMELPDPALKATCRKLGDGCFLVCVTAKWPALWVRLDVEGTEALFSDNYFHLSPAGCAEIVVQADPITTVAEFRKKLRLRSLVDLCG